VIEVFGNLNVGYRYHADAGIFNLSLDELRQDLLYLFPDPPRPAKFLCHLLLLPLKNP
jgi:hypothetical protein